jgi:ribosomal protein L40E
MIQTTYTQIGGFTQGQTEQEPPSQQTIVTPELSEKNEDLECKKCGWSNPVDSKFCNRCGSPLSAVCPNCGNKNPSDAAFCNECGSKISEMNNAAENTDNQKLP